ncbi:MAG: PEP-CTERM sorting domain-containing protein [Elainella sp. Prado103]|jgi:hypothetical protein|nr:PEP-CTERM sorting domain-containing protein [Elainella sp. Prado103]
MKTIQNSIQGALKNTTCMAGLALLATIASAGSAEAISFKITRGIANPTTGATNQGSYSDFAGTKGTTTIDFNDGFAAAGAKSVVAAKDNQGNALVTYHFDGANGMATKSGRTGVYADVWAPAGWETDATPESSKPVDYVKDSLGNIIGESVRNTSNYLAVFQSSMVKITFGQTMNYFGINWGAISGGNTFSFFRNGQAVKTFTTADVNPVAPLRASWQNGGEGSGFLHFYSDNSNDIFDEIRITQAGGGGFETDNHSFHSGTGAFDFERELKDVPEPGVVFGLMAMGGLFVAQRNKRKAAKLA